MSTRQLLTLSCAVALLSSCVEQALPPPESGTSPRALEVPSHRALTEAALRYYADLDAELEPSAVTYLGYLLDGARDEDELGDVILLSEAGLARFEALPEEAKAWVAKLPTRRPFHHFYDFSHRAVRGGRYKYDPFWDSLLDAQLLSETSAKTWAEDAALQTKAEYGGTFTWGDAIAAYRRGDMPSAHYFLGHVLHLIEDMTVPAHTRDDAHVWASCNSPVSRQRNLTGCATGNCAAHIRFCPPLYEDWVVAQYPDATSMPTTRLAGTAPLASPVPWQAASTQDLRSLGDYFDYLSEYTQQHFYSGGPGSIPGTGPFLSSVPTDPTRPEASTNYASPRASEVGSEVDEDGVYWRFAYATDSEGRYRLAYEGIAGWSSEHPLVFEDTFRRTGKVAMQAVAGVAKLFLRQAPLTPPTSPAATALSQSEIAVTWAPPPDAYGVASYRLYRGVNGPAAPDAAALTQVNDATQYRDTGVDAGTTYCYQLTTIDLYGNQSARSEPPTCALTPPVTLYTISGTVAGAVASGVTMTLSGPASRTVTTGPGGTYSFTNLANGSYTVAPSRSGYAFTPSSRDVIVSGANVTGRDFTATAVSPTFSISGSISGAVRSGVLMSLGGPVYRTTTTDANGHYAFADLASGSYTVNPSLRGYGFDPQSLAVTVSEANVVGQDFASGSANDLICGFGYATITYSGAVSGSVTRLYSSDYGDSTSGVYHLAGTLIGFSAQGMPAVGTYGSGVAFAASDLGSLPLSTTCPAGLHVWWATSATITFTSITPCGQTGWTPGAIAVHGTLTAVATPWSYTDCELGTGQVTVTASF